MHLPFNTEINFTYNHADNLIYFIACVMIVVLEDTVCSFSAFLGPINGSAPFKWIW